MWCWLPSWRACPAWPLARVPCSPQGASRRPPGLSFRGRSQSGEASCRGLRTDTTSLPSLWGKASYRPSPGGRVRKCRRWLLMEEVQSIRTSSLHCSPACSAPCSSVGLRRPSSYPVAVEPVPETSSLEASTYFTSACQRCPLSRPCARGSERWELAPDLPCPGGQRPREEADADVR